AAFPAFALAFLETRVVGGVERLLEYTEEVTAVVRHVRCGFEGQVAFADHIAPTQVEAVDAEFGRGKIERALDVVIAFGSARAAIGRDKRRVGENAFGRNFDQRRTVHTGDVFDLVSGRQQRPKLGEIAAHVAVSGQADRKNMRIVVECHFNDHVLRATVMVRYETTRAFIRPFDRPPELARAMKDADIFGVHRGLHAKRAADLAGDY